MSKRILIIEDDVFFAEVLKDKLENAGFIVENYSDGQQGLEKIKETKPDLVLLDIMLPSMSGYEILEKKREDESIKSIPVIVISNSGQPVELERVLDLGAKDYLIKAQFGPNEVIDKVGAHFASVDPQEKIEKEKIESQSPISIEGKKIVIVEDDEFLSDLLKEKFKIEKADVTHVTNGVDLLSSLEDLNPDLILLDIVLPKMDGYDILDAIKSNEKTSHIPVVMLSNLGQESDIKRGKQKGAERFLVKAMFSLDEVVTEVKQTLQNK